MQQSASWKTTASGVVVAMAGFVYFSPETFAQWPWVLSLAKYIMLGGIAGLGSSARDFNVRSSSPVTPALTPAQKTTELQVAAGTPSAPIEKDPPKTNGSLA